MADVGVGPLPRSGAVTRDGKGETVAGMVIMLKGENGKDVATRVKARIAEIQKTLPAGMRIAPFYDQSEVIDRTSHTVTKNLLEGSLLVVAVLFFFLRDVRASLIVASVIPLAMLAGFLGMRLFGVSANLMSLGAIDFGLIVDGAVVMMENFIRRRAEHDPTGEPDFVADPASHRRRFFTSAATEVARPVLFGVLIIVAVYVPVFTLEGLEGKMFRPMAITVCSAILGRPRPRPHRGARGVLLPPEGRGHGARGGLVPAAPPLLRGPPRGRDEPPAADARGWRSRW